MPLDVPKHTTNPPKHTTGERGEVHEAGTLRQGGGADQLSAPAQAAAGAGSVGDGPAALCSAAGPGNPVPEERLVVRGGVGVCALSHRQAGGGAGAGNHSGQEAAEGTGTGGPDPAGDAKEGGGQPNFFVPARGHFFDRERAEKPTKTRSETGP